VGAAVAALAARQHAVVGLDQLRALGLTARAIQKRTDNGRLHRIYHGVYALVPRKLLTVNGLYMAAVLACGPGRMALAPLGAAARRLARDPNHRTADQVPARRAACHGGVVAGAAARVSFGA
jgi:hypothetical protein